MAAAAEGGAAELSPRAPPHCQAPLCCSSLCRALENRDPCSQLGPPWRSSRLHPVSWFELCPHKDMLVSHILGDLIWS